MTEKQQIAEAERRFNNWWEAEGEEELFKHIPDPERKEIKSIEILIKIAWMNGAFVARENN